MSPALKGPLLGLTGFGLYSLADATIKFLGAGFSPIQIVAFANLCTYPLIALIWLHERGPLSPAYPGLMAIRSVALVMNGLLVTYAFTVIPLAEAYAIFFTMPLMITLMAWLFLGEQIDPWGGLAILVGLAGVLIALDPRGVKLGWGHMAAVAGAVSGAVHYLIVRKTSGVESRAAMMFYPIALQTLVAFSLLQGRYLPMSASDLCLIGAMTVAGFSGMLLTMAAYRIAAPIAVAPTQYSQIAWAALFGALFFNEPMHFHSAIGMGGIALAGLIIVARQNHPARVED